MYLIRAGAIDNLELLLRKKGQNSVAVLAELNLNSAILREPETLVSYAKMAELLEYCATLCHDPLFGFHLAQVQSPLALGEFASLINQQRTFRDALHFSQKYLYLHARGLSLKQIATNDRIEIHCEFDFINPSGFQQLSQLSIGQQVQYVKVLMPQKYLQLGIHTRQPITKEQAMHLGEYQKLLRRGAKFDGISFPGSWLDKEISKSAEVAKVYSEQRIKALNAYYPNDLPSQVKYLCSNLMATADCTIEHVAAALNMQPRTLQRSLKSKGYTFRDLLKTVRLVRAKQYLQNTNMSITDIALNLGYADTAVFSRNFKLWTGKSAFKWRTDYTNL